MTTLSLIAHSVLEAHLSPAPMCGFARQLLAANKKPPGPEGTGGVGERIRALAVS
jgi:hypothetical protein